MQPWSTEAMARSKLPGTRYLPFLGMLILHTGLHLKAEDCNAGQHATQLTVNYTTSTEIGLSWNDSLRCADHFTVSWCNAPYPWIEDCPPLTRDLPANQTSYVISGLQPCSYYWVAVSAVRHTGATSRDYDLVVTSPAVGELRDMEVLHLGDRHFAASWDVVGDDACVEKYRVCWSTEGLREQCDHTNMSSYDFADVQLNACANYTVTVAALLLGDDTSHNATAYFHTGPDNVGDVKVRVVTTSTALVTWQPSPSSCADHYVLAWCLTDNPNGSCDPSSITTLNASVTEYNITTLEPCIYNVVSLSTRAADGRPSTGSKVVVNPTLDVLGPPTDVEVTVGNSKQFSLDYGAPEHAAYCVADYVGCFEEAGSPGQPACSRAFEAGYWSNTGDPTRACISYEVTLTAVSKDNRTAATSLSFTTPPDPVQDLRVRNGSAGPGGSSVVVTWQVSVDNGCLTHQHVRYSSYEEDLWAGDVNLTRDATEYVVTDMSPCTEYTLEVVEEPSSEFANTSNIDFFTASNVTSVTYVKVAGSDDSSVNISYLAPEVSPRCVSKYSVCWRQVTSRETCHTRRGSGVHDVSIQGLTNCTLYVLSVTPVAPNDEQYTATTLTATTTGCTSGTSAVFRGRISHIGLTTCLLLFQLKYTTTL